MEIKIINREVLSSDSVHYLKGVIYEPIGEIKGVFQIVHGMTEYIGRYDKFMRLLASEGYLAFGYDHLGHGNTALSGEHGYIAKKDGYKLLVADVIRFSNAVREEYGKELPYILMGHSMGSFIVRLAASERRICDKLIIMGTGGPNPLSAPGIAIINAIKLIKGEKHTSPFIKKMAFGSYAKHFGSSHGWLTKDEKVIEKYKADPYCNFDFTLSAMKDLLRLISLSNSKRFFDSCCCGVPILIVSGEEDPVGDYSKGVIKVDEKLKAAGADVKTILYKNARHEILNDDSFSAVAADIMEFIK